MSKFHATSWASRKRATVAGSMAASGTRNGGGAWDVTRLIERLQAGPDRPSTGLREGESGTGSGRCEGVVELPLDVINERLAGDAAQILPQPNVRSPSGRPRTKAARGRSWGFVIPSGVRPKKRSAAASAMIRNWPKLRPGADFPAGVCPGAIREINCGSPRPQSRTVRSACTRWALLRVRPGAWCALVAVKAALRDLGA